MKTIIAFYPYLKVKLFNKKPVLFLSAIVITSLFASCTADEIEDQPQKVILKEIYFQRNDTILHDTIPTNTSTTTNGGEIDPPIIIPPKKP